MKGEVKIYKVYDNSEELIHSENNLIVDGMKEYFADVMSYFPSPSSLSADLSGYYAASGFGIKAWSLGPQRSRFLNENAWDGVSGYMIDYTSILSPSSVLSSFDEAMGHHLLPLPSNNKLTGENFKTLYPYNTGSNSKALLGNHNFSAVENKFSNSGFLDATLDQELVGSVYNDILNLYEVPFWDTSSTLRYFTSGLELSSAGDYGSLAVIHASSTVFSSTTASASNVLNPRSFSTSSNPETSGAVHISQVVVFPKNDFSPFVGKDSLLNPIGILEFLHYDISANNSTQTVLTLKDVTTGEIYDFATHAWSTSNTASYNFQGSSYVATTTPILNSLLFNFPAKKLNNKLRVAFSFYASATGQVFESYITEPVVGYLKDWKYGKLSPSDKISRRGVSGGLKVWKGVTSPSDVDIWGEQTMLIQSFSGLNPLKAYYQRVDASATKASASYKVRTSLVTSDNLYGVYKHDVAQQRAFSSLNEYISPNKKLSPLGSSTSFPLSHRCVQVEDSTALSAVGVVQLGKNYTLNMQTWDGYDESTSHCGISNLPPTGYIKTQFKVFRDDKPTLYWDDVSKAWTTSAKYTSLSGEGKGFQSKRQVVQITSTLQEYVNSPNSVSMSVQVLSSKGTSYFKGLELVGSRADVSAANFFDMDMSNSTSVSAMWSSVDNSSLSGNLSSLQYQQTVLDNIDDTTLSYSSPAAFSVYYESFIKNPLILHRENNECKYVFRVTQGAAIPTSNNVLYVDSIGMGDAGTVFLKDNSFTSDKSTSERSEGYSYQFYDDDTFHVTFGSGNDQRRASLLPAIPFNTSSFSLSSAIGYDPIAAGISENQRTGIEYTHCLSTLNMSGGDTVRMAFEYNSIDEDTGGHYTGVSSFIYGSVLCEISPGEVYAYNYISSNWEKVVDSDTQVATGQFRYNFTQARKGFGGVQGPFKTVKSPSISLSLGQLPPTAKLKWMVYYKGDEAGARNPYAITNIRFFRETDKTLEGFPVFPNPLDRTLQAPYPREEHSKFGHYPNYQAEFALSALSATNTLEQRTMAGSYLPTSGIIVSGLVYNAGFNQYSVVNSEGYIYESSAVANDNMGFTKKDLTTSNEGLLYTLALSPSESDYIITVKGGFGAIGMWVLDHHATYKKLKDLGTSLSELYNVTEVTNNPVFRLAAKKVFNIGGLQLNGSDTHIRIKWFLRFL